MPSPKNQVLQCKQNPFVRAEHKKKKKQSDRDVRSLILYFSPSLPFVSPLFAGPNTKIGQSSQRRKLSPPIDGFAMRVLSCPIWALTGRQGRGLYYKGNQWHQAISLSMGCRYSFCSCSRSVTDKMLYLEMGKRKMEQQHRGVVKITRSSDYNQMCYHEV